MTAPPIPPRGWKLTREIVASKKPGPSNYVPFKDRPKSNPELHDLHVMLGKTKRARRKVKVTLAKIGWNV